MAHDEQDDRLDGPKEDERPACLIAEQVLGVVAHTHDRPSAGPRRVDATLNYPDGRRAAFEVLRLAERADLHVDARLRDERYVWRVPGATSIWTLVVPSVDRPTGLRGLPSVPYGPARRRASATRSTCHGR